MFILSSLRTELIAVRGSCAGAFLHSYSANKNSSTTKKLRPKILQSPSNREPCMACLVRNSTDNLSNYSFALKTCGGRFEVSSKGSTPECVLGAVCKVWERGGGAEAVWLVACERRPTPAHAQPGVHSCTEWSKSEPTWSELVLQKWRRNSWFEVRPGIW